MSRAFCVFVFGFVVLRCLLPTPGMSDKVMLASVNRGIYCTFIYYLHCIISSCYNQPYLQKLHSQVNFQRPESYWTYIICTQLDYLLSLGNINKKSFLRIYRKHSDMHNFHVKPNSCMCSQDHILYFKTVMHVRDIDMALLSLSHESMLMFKVLTCPNFIKHLHTFQGHIQFSKVTDEKKYQGHPQNLTDAWWACSDTYWHRRKCDFHNFVYTVASLHISIISCVCMERILYGFQTTSSPLNTHEIKATIP